MTKRLIPLALLCLWLCHDTLAQNDQPCQPTKRNNGFNTFLKRHVRQGTPRSLNQNQWQKFIRKVSCDRPTQSFLNPSQLEQVKAVCSDQGGKKFKKNLCISNQTFSFTTVRINTVTCDIRSVKREKKHLILACDRIDNQCLPVHFERNPENAIPNNNARGCRAL